MKKNNARGHFALLIICSFFNAQQSRKNLNLNPRIFKHFFNAFLIYVFFSINAFSILLYLLAIDLKKIFTIKNRYIMDKH